MRRSPARTLDGGFSLVEVLLAVLILALCLVPVLALNMQQTRGAWFTDCHLAARAHARRVAETLAAQDYDALRQAAASDDEGSLPSLLPAAAAELARLSGEAPLPRHLQAYATSRERFTQSVTFEELAPTGLARIVVRVSWAMPGESPAAASHDVTYVVFVSRRDLSLTIRPPAHVNGSLS